MSPIRLVILAILLYIGYLLIKGGSGNKKKVGDEKNDSEDSSAIADVLVEDPVCKKLVPRQQAVQLEYKDGLKYFCSQECCDTFVSEKGAEQ